MPPRRRAQRLLEGAAGGGEPARAPDLPARCEPCAGLLARPRPGAVAASPCALAVASLWLPCCARKDNWHAIEEMPACGGFSVLSAPHAACFCFWEATGFYKTSTAVLSRVHFVASPRAAAYCTFGFRETIFLGIIEFHPGYGGFVTFESELVPKLVSELVSDY